MEIRELRKSFGANTVLKGIDLTVEKGDVIAILGPSGSGKTTLLRCINFLEKSDSGTMIFDNETYDLGHMRKADIAAIRKNTAFVFQNYNLWTRSACRTARTTTPSSSPADSSSVSRSQGRWRQTRRSSILTSRLQRSIPN